MLAEGAHPLTEVLGARRIGPRFGGRVHPRILRCLIIAVPLDRYAPFLAMHCERQRLLMRDINHFELRTRGAVRAFENALHG